MQLDLICITDLTGSWLVVALTTFVGVLLYHTYWPKLQQKRQQLHRREERETANDSSSEEEVTTSDEAQPLLTPTTSIVEFPNPQFHNEINNNPRPLKVATFTELREPLDLIDTNDL